MSPKPPSDGYVCPHCGEPLPRKATFCRHCGSDENTGWSNDTDHTHDWEDSEELAESYDHAYEREFGKTHRPMTEKLKAHRKRSGIPWWVMAVSLIIAGLFAWQLLKGLG